MTEADSVSSGNLPAQSESTESADISRADSETEAFEFLRVLSSLTGFEIKLFRDEPKLVWGMNNIRSTNYFHLHVMM